MDPQAPAIAAAAYLRAASLDAAPGGSAPAARQRAVLETFAAAHCLRIDRWFEDQDPPGPPEAREPTPPRPALAALLAHAASPGRDFEFVLVHDAARLDRAHAGDWQGIDAELRAAGSPPLYAAEPHRNDGRAIGRRLKALFDQDQRADLARRVAAGKRRWFAHGFHPGGSAPYGYRRQQIGWNQSGRILEHGEGAPQGRFRSVLVPGPAQEVDTVRRIFTLYGRGGLSLEAIARRLNVEGVPAGERRLPWSKARIKCILGNETYAGVLTYGRLGVAPDGRRVPNPRSRILRLPDACEPIIGPTLFEAARARREGRTRRFTNDEILEGLRRVLKTHGVITNGLVDDDPELPSSITVRVRFGGMRKALARIGYEPPGDWERRRAMERVRGAGAMKAPDTERRCTSIRCRRWRTAVNGKSVDV